MKEGIPGELRGSGIRTLSPEQAEKWLGVARQRAGGRRLRMRSARYRVTGFRDASSGAWVQRARDGKYYKVEGRARSGSARARAGQPGRHATELRPTVELLKRSDRISVEIEVDRGQGPRLYYTTISMRGG
jgi:hypothetical protein